MSLPELLWGEDELARRHEILRALSHYPLKTACRSPSALSRKELWVLRFQQNVELLELKQRLGWTDQHYLDALRIAFPDVASLSVNYRIFLKNLEAQMSPEQQAFWVPKARNFEISGCYAQTELGHGSNVRGIETLATFDPSTDEILLNSPTLSSHKYWIGGLGVVASHALVVARLIVSGKELGNHVFLVQVRDLETHELLPNIQIYEQGEKSMGTFACVDNGTMKFTNVRIPRSQMLSRFASLGRDGTYHKGQNTKHAYTSMVIIRGLMSYEIGQDVLKALIIALKYAKFRRQFNGKDGAEARIISYSSVQNRIYPAIARGITMMLVGRQTRDRVTRLQHSDLEDLHLQTVGIKIWATEQGVRDVEMARLLCGGHGNMASAGLGSIYAQLSPTRTYEGDNYVLSQQIGQGVLKYWNRRTETDVPAFSYLVRLRNTPKAHSVSKAQSHSGWFCLENQEEFLEYRACLLAKRHIDDTAAGHDTSYDVFHLAMAHADLTIWRGIQRQIQNAKSRNLAALRALSHVLSLTTMSTGLEAFVGTDFISEIQIVHLRAALRESISEFDKHVDALVDALGFTESELNSDLAREGQNPYEALWQTAQQSEMNNDDYVRSKILAARRSGRTHRDSLHKL